MFSPGDEVEVIATFNQPNAEPIEKGTIVTVVQVNEYDQICTVEVPSGSIPAIPMDFIRSNDPFGGMKKRTTSTKVETKPEEPKNKVSELRRHLDEYESGQRIDGLTGQSHASQILYHAALLVAKND